MKKSKLPIVFGLGISALLTLTFLFFSAFNLHTNPIFSIINVVVMALGMLMFLREYNEEKGKYFNCQKGFVAIFFTGLIANLFFIVFFVFFSSVIEPSYIIEMTGHWGVYYKIPEELVVFVVFAMGVVTTMMLSLAFMQLFEQAPNRLSIRNSIKRPNILLRMHT